MIYDCMRDLTCGAFNLLRSNCGDMDSNAFEDQLSSAAPQFYTLDITSTHLIQPLYTVVRSATTFSFKMHAVVYNIVAYKGIAKS